MAKRKRSNFRTFYIDIPVFNAGLRVIVCEDIIRVEQVVTKWYGENYKFTSARPYGKFIWLEDSTLAPTIWLSHSPKTPYSLGAMVHECNHFRDYVFSNQNINDEEAAAYFIEFLVREILTR